jgi:hypothetical protein
MFKQSRKYALYCAITIAAGAAFGLIAFFASERSDAKDERVSFDLGCIREHGIIADCEVTDHGQSFYRDLSKPAAKFLAAPMPKFRASPRHHGFFSTENQKVTGDSSMNELALAAKRSSKSSSERVSGLQMQELATATASHSTESGQKLATASLEVPASVEANPIFVDEQAMLNAKPFALPPTKLISLAKRFLASRGGFGADPDLLSEDFKFVGPVVGPLPKDAFVSAIGSVDIAKGFPDFQGEFYGFSVDPFERNRVWYTARGKGTNTGPLPPFAPTPTGKSLVNPPQACSLTFGEDGLVTKYTIGYVMDREVGNTGGLGGLYGVLYAIGRPLPFREAQPWKMSRRYRLFQGLGNLASKLAPK